MAREDLIKFRRGTAAAAASSNPVLASGEPGVETDTGRIKVGNGVDAWNDLPYSGSTGADPLEQNPIENEYADTAAMLADQGNQTTGFFQYVSADDDYYEKLATSTADISDYRLLNDDEVTVIQGSNSWRTFRVDSVNDDTTPLTSVANGRIGFDYDTVTDKVTSILFDRQFTKVLEYVNDLSGSFSYKIQIYSQSERRILITEITSFVTVGQYLRAVVNSEIDRTILSANDRIEVFLDIDAEGGGSIPVSKTGTNLVFTENAYYNKSTYLTSGNLILDLINAVENTWIEVFCDRYKPEISGEDYLITGFTDAAALNILHFYYDGEQIRLNIDKKYYIADPIDASVGSGDTEILINITDALNSTAREILISTTDDINNATAATGYNGTDLTHTETGVTNLTLYYVWIRNIGAGYLKSNYIKYEVTPVSTAFDATDLVGAYEFNELVGTTLEDAHTSANDGTNNGATINQTGLLNGCYSFDGINDFVDLSALNGVFNNSDFTIIQWFKTTQTTAFRLLNNRSTGGFGTAVGFVTGVTNSNYGGTYLDDGAGNSINFSNASYNEDDDNWHMFALTFNTSTGNAKLYIDSVLVSDQVNANLAGADFTSLDVILSKRFDGSQNFAGEIDMLRVFQRELVTTELNEHYNSGIGLEY